MKVMAELWTSARGLDRERLFMLAALTQASRIMTAAEETAATIRGLRTWQTDEYEHNGLRADGERVLGRLIDLVRGRA